MSVFGVKLLPAITIEFFFSTGEFGGNMGLFLGCSLLTICEFFDFLFEAVMSRLRKKSVNVLDNAGPVNNS